MDLVENTQPRIIRIGLMGGGSIRLLPGVNKVDSKEWKQVVDAAKAGKLAVVASYIKNGTLRPARLGLDDTKPALKSMKPAGAVELVGRTFDLALLAEWKGEEDRGLVLKAIDLQIDSIKAMKTAKTDDKPKTDDESAK